MTTTCLRSLKFNLHPKLALIQGRISASHEGSARKVAHSQFLNEFLDNHTAWRAERTTHLSPLPRAVGLVAYDPTLHAVVKPVAETSDDIVLPNNTSSAWCPQLVEDDLLRDVIQRENYSVTVIAGTRPIGAQVATTWSVNSTLNVVPEKGTVFSSSQGGKSQPPSKNPGDKPTEEQLDIIQSRLITTMSLLRLIGHCKFGYVKLELLKVTKHTEDGTIRVRWRIRGVPALRTLLQFWRIKFWKLQIVKGQEIDWYDGFSTFYVNGNGLIHRHVCDKMMPDDNKAKVKATAPMAAKLALIIGVLPRTPLEDICSFSAAEPKLHNIK